MALSHRAKIAKKRLRREVVAQLGARKPIDRRQFALVRAGKSTYDIDAQITRQANPAIDRMFAPHRKSPYPLDQAAHDFSKMPGETVHNFVPIQAIASELRAVPQIAELLRVNPQLAARFERQIRTATRERGMKATKFWEIADKGYIDRIAAAGKGNPNRMNQVTGERIAQAYGKAVVPRTHLDIGSFAGGTAIEIAKALSPKQRKLFKVVLVDVAGDMVKKYAVPGLVATGVPRENTKVIPASFYKAAIAFGQMPRPLHEKGERNFAKEFIELIGKVDSGSAGAATINFATDLRPYLKSIKTLLKPGGVFVNWDWGSVEVRKPAVNVPALKKAYLGLSPEGRKISQYDAYVSFLNFWMRSYGYPPVVVERMVGEINTSKRFNFIDWLEKHREWIEHERQTVKWTDKATGKEMIGRPGLQKPFGYRNRAYRTGEAMRKAALRLGLSATHPEYPVAKPGEMDTGNLNWLMVMHKR